MTKEERLEEYEKLSLKVHNAVFNNYIAAVINYYKNNEKTIDMHVHSNYSDGDMSPNELIKFAVENLIDIISITDHDTIEGIKNLNRDDKFVKLSGIKIINGIELSAKSKKGRMHILGYGIDIDNESLNKKMIELKDNSINSVLSIMEQIKRDYNIRF